MKISEMIRQAQAPDDMAAQLAAGRKVEMEHKATIEYLLKNPNTPLEKVVEMIARDHLKEFPDYYTRLDKMEKEAKAAKAGKAARAAQGEEDCPEGFRWCPIQKKCVPAGSGMGRRGQADPIQTKLIEFFKKNPNPPDSKVHQLAEQLKLPPDQLESKIYELLSDLLKRTGE